MQSDWQSIEKVPFSTFLRTFAPKMCEKNVSLASEWVGLFSMINLEQFPASPGAQLQEITGSTFSIQLGKNRLRSGIGIVFDPVR